MGNVAGDRGDFDGALEYYRKSLEIDEELGDEKGMSACYKNMGVMYAMKKDRQMAQELWQKAVNLRKRMGLDTGELEELIDGRSLD